MKSATSAGAASRTRVRQSGAAEPRDQYFSRAVSKALEVLELFHASQCPMALNDIAKAVHLSKTSAFRVLRTMESVGYLTSTGWGQYSLPLGTQSIVAMHFVARLLHVATPHVQELSRELHESASLAALFDNRVEVVTVVESSQAIRMSNVVGLIVPPNASSLGKAITAFQNDQRREKLLRSYGLWRFTEHTVVDRNELDREYSRVCGQGFAVDREETVPGGNCFGVPIRGASNEVAAALSVSVPKGRVLDAKHEKAIVAAVKGTADRISVELREVTGASGARPSDLTEPRGNSRARRLRSASSAGAVKK